MNITDFGKLLGLDNYRVRWLEVGFISNTGILNKETRELFCGEFGISDVILEDLIKRSHDKYDMISQRDYGSLARLVAGLRRDIDLPAYKFGTLYGEHTVGLNAIEKGELHLSNLINYTPNKEVVEKRKLFSQLFGVPMSVLEKFNSEIVSNYLDLRDNSYLKGIISKYGIDSYDAGNLVRMLHYRAVRDSDESNNQSVLSETNSDTTIVDPDLKLLMDKIKSTGATAVEVKIIF